MREVLCCCNAIFASDQSLNWTYHHCANCGYLLAYAKYEGLPCCGGCCECGCCPEPGIFRHRDDVDKDPAITEETIYSRKLDRIRIAEAGSADKPQVNYSTNAHNVVKAVDYD